MGQKFIVKLRTEVKFQLGVLLRGYCVDDMSGSSEKGSGSSSLASSAMATPTATLRSLKKISSTQRYATATCVLCTRGQRDVRNAVKVLL